MLGFTVSQFPLKSFPAGTKVTLLSWVNNPIWVQIDSNSQTHSYETLGVASYSICTQIGCRSIATRKHIRMKRWGLLPTRLCPQSNQRRVSSHHVFCQWGSSQMRYNIRQFTPSLLTIVALSLLLMPP